MSKNKPLLNRDISALRFNARVLDEAFRSRNRLQERLNFLGIAASNMREFASVRYPAALEDAPETAKDLAKSYDEHYELVMAGWKRFNKKTKLVRRVKDLSKSDRRWANRYFEHNVFPALLPITVDPARKATITGGMYVLVVTENKDEERATGYIEIPTALDRFIKVDGKNYAIAIEDLIQCNLSKIIKKKKILDSCAFHIVRSAEVYNQIDQIMDPYEHIQSTLKERENSWVAALEISGGKKRLVKLIRKLVPMEPDTLVLESEMINLGDLMHYPTEIFQESERMRQRKRYNTWPLNKSVFSYIKSEDRLALHPYESYDDTFVRFLEEAAGDPNVVSIRISLYRVAERSRIIDALVKAASDGKLVTVLVELKARFDERHNIQVSNVLREAGVRIVFTEPDMKTHAKVCLVTRKEKKGLKVYSHIGTGNYHERTSGSTYSDYSYFTADQDIGEELTRFFNVLTSDNEDFKTKHICYAPYNLRETIYDEIDRQIKLAKKHKGGNMILKCNALTDEEMARKIQDAAKAGVKVKLIIRGACVLQPQKNLTIRSLVGAELEHARIYCFGKGSNASIWLGSSDLMTRNLSNRHEVLINIDNHNLQKRLIAFLKLQLRDNCNAREIGDDYKYHLVKRGKKDKDIDAMAICRKETKGMAL